MCLWTILPCFPYIFDSQHFLSLPAAWLVVFRFCSVFELQFSIEWFTCAANVLITRTVVQNILTPSLSLLQNHQYHCPRFPVQCPNQCGTPNIAREDLANHVKDNCGSALILCPFKEAGCKHRVRQIFVSKRSFCTNVAFIVCIVVPSYQCSLCPKLWFYISTWTLRFNENKNIVTTYSIWVHKLKEEEQMSVILPIYLCVCGGGWNRCCMGFIFIYCGMIFTGSGYWRSSHLCSKL